MITTIPQKTGVPANSSYVLAGSGMPMVLPSSGTIGANGALSGLTALPAIYAKCYMWFPAGAINAGSVAGMYYVEMSSTTAGTIYNNIYTGGNPLPPEKVAFSGTTGIAYTQSTGSYITMISVTVPGGAMGAYGGLRVTYLNSRNASGALSVQRGLFFGGVNAASASVFATSQLQHGEFKTIRNQGASTQVTPGYGNDGVPQTVAIGRLSRDTSVDQALSITLYLQSATDTATVESFTIEVLPQ